MIWITDKIKQPLGGKRRRWQNNHIVSDVLIILNKCTAYSAVSEVKSQSTSWYCAYEHVNCAH